MGRERVGELGRPWRIHSRSDDHADVGRGEHVGPKLSRTFVAFRPRRVQHRRPDPQAEAAEFLDGNLIEVVQLRRRIEQ